MKIKRLENELAIAKRALAECQQGNVDARVTELEEQVSIRDARIAELEEQLADALAGTTDPDLLED